MLHAYGWEDLAAALADHRPAAAEARAAAVATLLERLVALNSKRAVEEAAGTVRWLRPAFQAAVPAPAQGVIEGSEGEAEPTLTAAAVVAAVAVEKRAWPSGLPEQIKAVSEVMATAGRPLTLDDLAAHFTARGRWRDRLPTIVETLEAIGRARRASDRQAWAVA